MALAERLPDDTSLFLKNTRNLGKQKKLNKKKRTLQSHAKWAAVNDGDDGSYNDDEDAVNKTENYGHVLGSGDEKQSKNFLFHFSPSLSLAPLKQLL